MVSAISSNRAKLVPAFFILVFCAWHTAGSWYVSAECKDECWVKTKLSIRCCGKAEEGACELWPGDGSVSLRRGHLSHTLKAPGDFSQVE